MTGRISTFLGTIILISGLGLIWSIRELAARGPQIPDRLSDQEFWQLSNDASEPDGFYRSDNLTSNELLFQRVIPELVARAPHGGVYLGVGPEQNFTYIAAVRPALAVIVDIRRRNLQLQLMYKALFELAHSRADFVSMLFSKPRPAGLPDSIGVKALFEAFDRMPGDDRLYAQTLDAIRHQLLIVHHLPLSDSDIEGIEYVFHAFFFNRAFAVLRGPRVQYSDMMSQTDGSNTFRSYLASEALFRVIQQLEQRNLVVPVVGNFAGSRAIRTIAAKLQTFGATVSVFYLSNVEEYLSDADKRVFCGNIRSLPIQRTSTFIRASSRPGTEGSGLATSLASMAEESQRCAVGGQ
jgi:hypothetical protein